MRAVMWLCPDADSFHEEGPIIFRLLLVGAEVKTKITKFKQEGKTYTARTHYFAANDDACVVLDYPAQYIVDMIAGLEIDLDFEEDVCDECLAKGVVAWHPLEEEDDG